MRVSFHIRGRSAVLIQCAKRVGTMRALGEKLKISQADMSAYCNFRLKPRSTLDRIAIEIALAEILGRPVSFDEAFLPWSLKSNVVEREANIPLAMLEPPKTPEQLLLAEEQTTEVRRVLDVLTPRHRAIIEARFGFDGDPETLEEVASKTPSVSGFVGDRISRDRVRQLELEALRKLRLIFSKANPQQSPRRTILLTDDQLNERKR